MLLVDNVKSFNNLHFQSRNTIFGERVFVKNQSERFKKREIYAFLFALIEKDNKAEIQDCKTAIEKIVIIPPADKKDTLFFINWIAFVIQSCKKIKNFFIKKPYLPATSDIIKDSINKLIELRENQKLLEDKQSKTIKLRQKLNSVRKEKSELLKEKSVFELSQKSDRIEMQQLKEISSRVEEIKKRNESLLKENLSLKEKNEILEDENRKTRIALSRLTKKNMDLDEEDPFEPMKENKSSWSISSLLGGFVSSPKNDPNYF